MTNYPIGDFIIQIKNAVLSRKKEVEVLNTKLIESVAKFLKDEGFLQKVEKKGNKLIVQISYRNKRPVLIDVKIKSRPGLRIYMTVDEIEKHKKPSILIVSTSKGIVSSKKAIKERTGGEVIAEIW